MTAGVLECPAPVNRWPVYALLSANAISTIGNMLDFARYDRDAVRDRFHGMIDARVKAGGMAEKVGATLKARYDAHIKGITYLV